MPGQDGTGPAGQGPLTGRGLGPCGCGMRRGFRRGFGSGLGRRFGFKNQVILTQTEEKKILESELKELDSEKQEIEKRLKELK